MPLALTDTDLVGGLVLIACAVITAVGAVVAARWTKETRDNTRAKTPEGESVSLAQLLAQHTVSDAENFRVLHQGQEEIRTAIGLR